MSQLAPTSLSGFLRFLSAAPAGSAVAEAAVRGPLSVLEARATTIFAAQGSDLVLQGTYGSVPEYSERFHTFSISSPFAVCRAYRQAEVIEHTHLDPSSWLSDYDRELIGNEQTAADGRALSMTALPIISRGRAIGVWTLMTPESVTLDHYAHLHLEGVSSAIGMWMALQEKDRNAAANFRRERLSPHARITGRQLEVLRLLGAGKTNLQISVRLGFSDSTVKKEVQQIMVYLNVHDREAAVARARELGLLDPE